MRTRPASITFVAWLFVVVGCASLGHHAWRMIRAAAGAATDPWQDLGWVLASAALSVAGGAFALRGRNWARWALTLWMAGHVVLGLFHPLVELAVHVTLFTPLVFLLFRPSAGAYFRGADPGSRPLP